MHHYDPTVEEIFVILQEECAELIQEVSKIKRFGIDDKHKDGLTHRAKLEMEVGDVLCMIDLLIEHGVVDKDEVQIAKVNKIHKLHKYSNIYEE
jgi:NTP pyrophosphatase (non-canonical NTP hydrolase)